MLTVTKCNATMIIIRHLHFLRIFSNKIKVRGEW